MFAFRVKHVVNPQGIVRFSSPRYDGYALSASTAHWHWVFSSHRRESSPILCMKLGVNVEVQKLPVLFLRSFFTGVSSCRWHQYVLTQVMNTLYGWPYTDTTTPHNFIYQYYVTKKCRVIIKISLKVPTVYLSKRSQSPGIQKVIVGVLCLTKNIYFLAYRGYETAVFFIFEDTQVNNRIGTIADHQSAKTFGIHLYDNCSNMCCCREGYSTRCCPEVDVEVEWPIWVSPAKTLTLPRINNAHLCSQFTHLGVQTHAQPTIIRRNANGAIRITHFGVQTHARERWLTTE